MTEVLFFIAAIGAIAGAIGVVALQNPFYSVLALFVELAIALLASGVEAIGTDGPTVPLGFGGPEQIGAAFLTKFLLAFELASYLLLIAAVGAVVLGRPRGGIHEEETRVSVSEF